MTARLKIGLAKEIESPENPGGLEERVALIPKDIARLKEAKEASVSISVSVEDRAGERMGFSNSSYEAAGAQIESAEEIYSDKDLVIKLKGPPLSAIGKMRRDSTLLCMAHFHSYPDRARALEEAGINVIAMEEILESPKYISDEIILSKVALQRLLDSLHFDRSELSICFLGYHPRVIGAIRRAGNRTPHGLAILQADTPFSDLPSLDPDVIYVYDSKSFPHLRSLGERIRTNGALTLDLAEFESASGKEAIQTYRDTHPPHPLGMRRIQCLHQTGRAGARYGYRLLESKSVSPAVLGYGNVGMGAIHECYEQGAKTIQVLTRRTTAPQEIVSHLERANLIINGAEQPRELRGKNFLIRKEHTENAIQTGSVVIDLIGGSPTNRSPVEDVIQCTFMDSPYIEKNGIKISSLWGWPMMPGLGFAKETATVYSAQITEVLLEKKSEPCLLERIASKTSPIIDQLPPGLSRAWVSGPHDIL